MSKTNPNQDHYKIAGRAQTDGPDRMETNVAGKDKREMAQNEKNLKHPAVMKSKKK
jgi:hypothetical protein